MLSDQTPNTEAAAAMERLLAGAWVAHIVQATADSGSRIILAMVQRTCHRSPTQPRRMRPLSPVCYALSPLLVSCLRTVIAATHHAARRHVAI
jgi:hypothetical protein